MDIEPVNDRGFMIGKFKDSNGVECSIQESSAMRTEEEGGNCLWFGANDIGLKIFIPNGNPSWRDIDIKDVFPQAETALANTRMHLSQEDVRKLLPTLEYFAEHGLLPTNTP